MCLEGGGGVEKLKMFIYSPNIPSRFCGLYINYPHILELTLSQSHLPGENAALFLQLKPFTQYQFLIPPGTNYCWVDRLDVGSKLAQSFYTGPALQESNPRHLDLGSNALTTRPRAPLSSSSIPQTS